MPSLWRTKTTTIIRKGSSIYSISNGSISKTPGTPTSLQLAKTGLQKFLTKDEYLRRTAEKLRHESAGVAEPAPGQAVDREPIQKDKTKDAEIREEYLQHILNSDRELDVNQILGADHVVHEQEGRNTANTENQTQDQRGQGAVRATN